MGALLNLLSAIHLYSEPTSIQQLLDKVFCFCHYQQNKQEEAEDRSTEEELEEDTAEEDQDQEDFSEADEEFDPEDEEDSPPPRKKRKPPSLTQQVGQRKRGRPAGSRVGVMDQLKATENVERRRKRSEQEHEQMEKDMQVLA